MERKTIAKLPAEDACIGCGEYPVQPCGVSGIGAGHVSTTLGFPHGWSADM